ncbi:hypothetical protein ACOSQ2_033153 [Xanthoceras sorbifolium]
MPPRRRTRGQESRTDTPPPPPPQPINEQLVNLLEAVMRMSATQTVHVKDKNERLRDFCRIFDAQFDGRQDPIAADRWLKAIRRAFSQVDTPSEFWVDFAVYRLTGDAVIWWENLLIQRDMTGVDWEVFEGLFRDNYFNAGHRRMLADMFENIEQGGMTVNEYYTRFMELFQYAGRADESLLLSKFLMRLRPTIRNRIYTQEFRKLTDCLAAAILAETNFRDIQPPRNQPSGSRDRKMTKKNQGGWRGPNYATSGSGTSSGSSGRSSPYGNCYNCGQQGHLKKASIQIRLLSKANLCTIHLMHHLQHLFLLTHSASMFRNTNINTVHLLWDLARMFLKIFRFHKHLGVVALQATTWVLMLVGAVQEREEEKEGAPDRLMLPQLRRSVITRAEG